MREDWEIKKLKEVTKIVNGGTPKSKVKEYWSGNIDWITPADLGKLDSRYVFSTSRKISKLGLQKSSAKLLPLNSIILSTRAPIGHLAINKTEISTNQGCRGIIPMQMVHTEFLFYYLYSKKVFLNSIGTGATFKELSSSNLASVEIPIPTLSEQKQIVAILDQAFEVIDRAKANIQKNIENARELFQSKLDEVFSQKGEGWEEKRLKDAFIIKPPKKEVHEKLAPSDKVSFLPMRDLNELVKNVIPQKAKLLTEVTSSYTYFAEDDVLLAKITPCFENGKLGIARNLENRVGFGSSEYIVIRSRGDITPDYLFYFLSRKSFRFEGERNMKGAVGHKRVSKEFIENYLIRYPAQSQQKEIVNIIDILENKTNHLNKYYKEKLDSLEELKKSLLQKAFEGELTQNDVEEISSAGLAAEPEAAYEVKK